MAEAHFVDEQIKKMIEEVRDTNPELAKYLEAHIVMNEEGICFKSEEQLREQE